MKIKLRQMTGKSDNDMEEIKGKRARVVEREKDSKKLT